MHTHLLQYGSSVFSVFISVFFLTACTTLQINEGGAVGIERHFGFPIVNIQPNDNALTAVRLHGTGIMVSDSSFTIGYADDFRVTQDLSKGYCSMIVLIESDVDATELLKEIRLNKEKYADICAVHINQGEGSYND